MENKILCGNTITHYTTTIEVEVTNYLHNHPRAKLNEVMTKFQGYNLIDVERYYHQFKEERKTNIKINLLLVGFFLLVIAAIGGWLTILSMILIVLGL